MVDLLGGGDGLRWQLGWLLAGMRGVHRLHGGSARLCIADTHRACSSADASAALLPERDRAREQRQGWLRHCMSIRHSARKQRPSSSIVRQQATAHYLVVYIGLLGLRVLLSTPRSLCLYIFAAPWVLCALSQALRHTRALQCYCVLSNLIVIILSCCVLLCHIGQSWDCEPARRNKVD